MSESTVSPFQLDEDTPQGLRDYVKRLEDQAKTSQEAGSKAAQLERELTFTKAGIDPDDAKAKYFVKGYDGELTPDAVKAAAVEAGLLEANPVPPEQSTANRMGRAEGAGGDDLPDYRQDVELFKAEMEKAHKEGGQKGLLDFLAKNGIENTLVQ